MRNYPINFVVKHQNLFSMSRKARPEAVETFRSKTSNRSASKSKPLNKWRRLGSSECDLVELTGIEPVTPCLQSRCSPS